MTVLKLFAAIAAAVIMLTACGRTTPMAEVSDTPYYRASTRSNERRSTRVTTPTPGNTEPMPPVNYVPNSDRLPEKQSQLPPAPSVSQGSPHPIPADVSTLPAYQQSNNSKPRELARFSTEYDAKDTARANNMSRASSAINQTIVAPGETFSYNQTVGPTTKERGYQESMIYIDGEKSMGYGGGVCQVSTTLHNAVANAGLEVLERHDHSLPVTYAKSGQEAATSYGGIDFKFKNNKPFPVVIHSHVAGGTVSATVSAV